MCTHTVRGLLHRTRQDTSHDTTRTGTPLELDSPRLPRDHAFLVVLVLRSAPLAAVVVEPTVNRHFRNKKIFRISENLPVRGAAGSCARLFAYKWFAYKSHLSVVGPCRPRIKGPLHARSPGPQVIYSPARDRSVMQSSDR